MGGQRHYKHARETRVRMLWDEYKKRNLRAKKGMSVFVEIVVVCVEVRAYRNL
jgi:hypothetical protein